MDTKRKTQLADPSSWPPGVHSITFDEAGGIGVDDEGRLYWHGKPVETKKRIELTTIERGFAIVGIVGAFIGGVATAIGVYLTHFP